MAQTPRRFGETTALGTTYTSLGTVPTSTSWNMLFNVTNRLTSVVKLRLYIADNSWASGEPTGGTLKAAIAYDLPVSAGAVIQVSGIVALTTEKIIARADTASALDIALSGMEIT